MVALPFMRMRTCIFPVAWTAALSQAFYRGRYRDAARKSTDHGRILHSSRLEKEAERIPWLKGEV